MFAKMDDDHLQKTGEEIFKYKNLVETIAIYRTRPEWYDQRGDDARGEGTLLAKSNKELGHEFEY